MNDMNEPVRSVEDCHTLMADCIEGMDPEPLYAAIVRVRDWLIPDSERLALLRLLEHLAAMLEEGGY